MMSDLDKAPQAHGWREAMARAWASPRCGACTRNGGSCRSPAMSNGRCRMHGGASTGPKTAEGRERARKAPMTHGRRSAAYLAHRQETRRAFVCLRDMIRAANAEMREEMRLNRAMLRRFGR
jgi:hypothetical protein